MASQPTTQFWPIFATKSDGQHIVSLKGRPVRNGPTEEQLNTSPNDQGQRDFYRLIEKDDPKHIDWRKKLGGMLLREIGGKPHEDKWQQCILWELPENYTLYEHIKTKADGQLKTVKNHSGGGHDRQDAYLYGYPKGPKKRFRSPVEFFPHLLWLCTDDTSDHNNCTCKMCSPAGDVDKSQVKLEVKPELPAAMKREPSSGGVTLGATPTSRNPSVQIPARRPSSGPPAQSPITKPTTLNPSLAPPPSAAQTRLPQTVQPSQLPDPRSLDQQVDLSYDKFLSRTGEVVWFFRGAAWGLGLVLRRWVSKEDPTSKCYHIQPLSHPFESILPETVTKNAHIMPWLAWSAPSCTNPYLRQNPQLDFDNADWRSIISGQYGDGGNHQVDASILAAKAIDSTYTLFERLKTSSDQRGTEIRHYNCIFLGAEKIWRGEPVRLRINTGSDIMVITDITEHVLPPNSVPANQPKSRISVEGDIYAYATLDAPDPSKPPQPPSYQDNKNIPSRMLHDIAWRNATLLPVTRTLAYWKLTHPQARLDISDLKGRWYETSLVFVEPFTKAVKNGEGGNGIWMNARGDTTGRGREMGVWCESRVAAFGRSVPKGVRIWEGVDVPEERGVVQPQGQQQQQQPQPQQQQGGQQQGSVDVEMGNVGGMGSMQDPFSIDEFMHVDSLGEDAGMEFSGHGHGGGHNFTF